ncbi:hypothetical protein BG006_004235 [Podila minutissima]|uniref:Uncharacterized protein n=1 Tax=Podila minutissima TaxID=64525 RepID=A0A9P5SLE6_9FUNG|nr:hypothetical protein BG006_004235 [Podila minutissima]
MKTALLLASAIATLVSATTYLEVTFSDDKWQDDAHFYSASTPLSSVFDTSNQDLIAQYTVKQEIHKECGGSYIKLLPAGYDGTIFNGESE